MKLLLMSIVIIAVLIGIVSALPEIQEGFDMKYKTSGTKLDTCDLCHIPGKPQQPSYDEILHINKKVVRSQMVENNLNPYGITIKDNLDQGIEMALTRVEINDSDKDGFTNLDEINNLTFPGNKKDLPNKKNNFFIKILEFLHIK